MAVGRALALELTKYGVLGWLGWVPGIALPDPPVIPHPGYTTPPPASALLYPYTAVAETKYGRGAQIGRSTLFIGPFLRV